MKSFEDTDVNVSLRSLWPLAVKPHHPSISEMIAPTDEVSPQSSRRAQRKNES